MSRLRLSFDELWTWIAIALPAFLALLVPLPSVDLAYQVRAGDEILAARALPAVDTWTFTIAGTPWVDQQWLAQVKLAAGYAIGGWELLAVARAVLVTAAVILMLATARERGASPRTAAILALAGFAIAAPAMALRPQLFGIVLFGLLVWMCARRERHPRVWLAAPLVLLLWANLHGSFVLGPVILGYAWLADVGSGRPWRTSLAVLVVGTVATFVNPYGPGAWGYALAIGASSTIASQVTEWQRTSPFAVPGILFYPSVVVTVALLWLRRGPRFTLADWLLLLGMALLGAWAVRGVAWWAFVMAFLLGAALARPSGAPAPERRNAANGVLAVALGVLIVVALPWWRPPDPLTGRQGLLSYAPSGLAQAVAALPAGARVVTPQTWGSWFEWAAPQATYFIDSRFELFPGDVWADHLALRGANPVAAQAVLDRWAVDVVVVPAGATPPPGTWTRLTEDIDGAVYTRAP